MVAENGAIMKIVKSYILSEESLDKDIDCFIRDARLGNYQYDYKNGMEGLKIIKQYFKMLQTAYDNGNYELCRICYKKLLLFLAETSYDEDYFNYEDILGRTKLDFEKIVGNYTHSMIITFFLEDFFREYLIFIEKMKDYDFESLHKTILDDFSDETLKNLEGLLIDELKAGLKEPAYWRYNIAYLLLDIYRKLKLREKYVNACKTFGYYSEEFVEMIDEYEGI